MNQDLTDMKTYEIKDFGMKDGYISIKLKNSRFNLRIPKNLIEHTNNLETLNIGTRVKLRFSDGEINPMWGTSDIEEIYVKKNKGEYLPFFKRDRFNGD